MRISELTKTYEGRTALRRVSFDFGTSGVVAITGPSGCGKTTLLRLLLGLETPDGGQIYDRGRCSCVFQEDRLIAHASAKENLRLVCRDESRLTAALRAADLLDFGDMRVSKLSGGMRRRVSVLRGALYDADMLLLDEPFAGLDEARRDAVAAYVKAGWRDRLVLLVTHDESDLSRMGASRRLVLTGSDPESTQI